MIAGELKVAVMDGEALVQHWPCSRTNLPDGSPGVMWRGVAYRLLPGNRIDISAQVAPEATGRHAVLSGDEASWVLIQGMPVALEAARKALGGGGVVVTRSGRWLGEAVGPVAFDWFLRCAGWLDEGRVAELLDQAHQSPTQNDNTARLAILEQRISNLLADVARAEAALRRSFDAPRASLDNAPAAAPTLTGEPFAPAELDLALQTALAEIEALRAALEGIGTDQLFADRLQQQSTQATRTGDEIIALLAGLRPDVILVRDSLWVALGEFDARAGFYKAIAELPPSGSRPDGWKSLRGAEKWWERHVSTGRNDHGRAYARYDTETRQWSLLLGWKVDQPQDIAWIKRQG
jgi:hypothetical protein